MLPGVYSAKSAAAFSRLYGLAYARVGPDLTIQQASPAFLALVDQPTALIGQPLSAVLWEFVGADEALRPVLAGVTGGLSGPAIRPIAVRCIYQVHAAMRAGAAHARKIDTCVLCETPRERRRKYTSTAAIRFGRGRSCSNLWSRRRCRGRFSFRRGCRLRLRCARRGLRSSARILAFLGTVTVGIPLLYKYGLRDYRGGGRSSARETAMRVAAGAIARKYLRTRLGVEICGYLRQLGPLVLDVVDLATVDDNPFFSFLDAQYVNDGKVIRLNLPPLTEERRRDLAKVVHSRLEESRGAVRNVRRATHDDMREFEKEKLISEDELKRGEQDLQKLTDKHVHAVDQQLAVAVAVEAGDQPQQRALARSRGAEQREEFARLDVEVDVLQHLGGAVGQPHVAALHADFLHALASLVAGWKRLCVRSTTTCDR